MGTVSRGGYVVDPQALVRGIVADPVRSTFYVSLSTDEVAMLDIASASIVRRLATPKAPGVMTVDSSGGVLYVALEWTHDIGVIDLLSFTYVGTIDLASNLKGPTGLVAGRPGRLYASCRDGLSIIDTVNKVPVYFGDAGIANFYGETHELSISRDRNHLFATNLEWSPARVWEVDVETDCPYYESQANGLGDFSTQSAPSPDGSRLYVSCRDPWILQGLAATDGVLRYSTAILTNYYPKSVVVAPSGNRVYAACEALMSKGAIVYADPVTLLPFHVETLQDDAVDRGLALSFDESTLAAGTGPVGSPASRVELLPTMAAPNRGGIRYSPVDSVTGVPLSASLSIAQPGEGTGAALDLANGVFGVAPMFPGAYDITVHSIGYRDVQMAVSINPGQWTDLGVLRMDRTGPYNHPYSLAVIPPLVPGSTMDVRVLGYGYMQGAVVASGWPTIVVNSFSYNSQSEVVANLTIDASVGAGGFFSPVGVMNPDGQGGGGALGVVVAPHMQVGPATIPSGTVGLPYSETLTVSGGVPPYVWAATAGALPTGLSLSSSGVISGTPSIPAAFGFRASTRDSTGCDAGATYSVVISGLGGAPANIIAGEGLGQPNPNRVRVFREDGSATTVDFVAYAAGQWGVNATGTNVTGAPIEQILTGPGPGVVFGPQVRAFSETGASIGKVNYYAYGTLRFGVNVASGNVDGDAFDEIVTGAGPGGIFGPHVRGWNFDNVGVTPMPKINYFAYGTLKFGVNPGAGAVDGDLYAELLTAPGPGPSFGPQVRGWNYDNATLTAISKINFNAFGTVQWGANVASGDVDADGVEEIACAVGPGMGPAFEPRFVGFNFDGASVSPLPGFDVTVNATGHGGRVGAGDVTGDGRAELIAGEGPDPAGTSLVRPYYYTGATLIPLLSFDAFPGQKYGVNASSANLGY
ncbi:MAG: putative Ig domain-containing protein [Acidobacteriota bacterium]